MFGEMRYHALRIHIDQILQLCFLFYKLTWSHKNSQFSARMVLVVLIILNTCILGFLCCVCGLVSLSSWLFLWFLICELVQVLFLIIVVNF